MGSLRSKIEHRHLTDTHFLSAIKLRHREVLELLNAMGFRGATSSSTFYEYIKSLRKLGIPMERGLARRGYAYYSYYHVMELALILTLRVYYFVPDSVLTEIKRYRRTLSQFYRRAYAERETHAGAPISLRWRNQAPVRARGVFLDLQMDFSGGRLTRFGPPRLLSPFQAIEVFANQESAARAFLPINLSLLAEHVVSAFIRSASQRRRE